MSEERKIVQAAGHIGVWTLLSRVTGLIRDMLIASLFGAGAVTDAFFVAFRIPNLLRPPGRRRGQQCRDYSGRDRVCGPSLPGRHPRHAARAVRSHQRGSAGTDRGRDCVCRSPGTRFCAGLWTTGAYPHGRADRDYLCLSFLRGSPGPGDRRVTRAAAFQRVGLRPGAVEYRDYRLCLGAVGSPGRADLQPSLRCRARRRAPARLATADPQPFGAAPRSALAATSPRGQAGWQLAHPGRVRCRGLSARSGDHDRVGVCARGRECLGPVVCQPAV